MKRPVQIALITAGCLGVYFVMRSLPVEKCAFLHYGEYVNSEGVIEGCGYEETEFFDLSKIRFPVVASLAPLAEPRLGEPLACELVLKTTTGRPLAWDDIAVSHTERVHAMVVDPSLEDYQHVHPQPLGAPGHYLLEMTPRRPGRHKVYLDFIPLASARRTLLECAIDVPGEPGKPQPRHLLSHSEGGLDFALVPASGRLVTGEELEFLLAVKTQDGSPTRFEPVMDAYAHVVAFDAAGTGFAHLHPVNPLVAGQDPLNPDLRFRLRFDKPGHYRMWAQAKVNGRQVFAPFDLDVTGSAVATLQ